MVLLYLSWLPQRSKTQACTDVSHGSRKHLFQKPATHIGEAYLHMVDRNFKVIMFLNVNLYCLYDTLWFCTFLGSFGRSLPTVKESQMFTHHRIMTCGSVSINAVIGDH